MRSTLAAATFLAGPPLLLWWVFGDPRRRLNAAILRDWLSRASGHLDSALGAGPAIWLGWIDWALLAVLLLGELALRLTRLRYGCPASGFPGRCADSCSGWPAPPWQPDFPGAAPVGSHVQWPR